jgi:NADH dehydrogenase
MSAARDVVVFGGTGFLGRRVVAHLLDHDFSVRIASRHPPRAVPAGEHGAAPAFVRTDVSDVASVDAALAGAFAAVNAISLYVEHGDQTFRAVHVEAAARLAERARKAELVRFVHVSGIGADARSASPYIASRGEGEAAVRAAFPAATIVRAAVMVGPDDAFLAPLTRLLRGVPVFPMFGRGKTALQPASVEDVGEAIARAIARPEPIRLCELAGPRTFTYETLLRAIARHIGARPILVPVPFGIWRKVAFIAEALPRPPITRNQVELMMVDNIASPDQPGFGALGIEPRGVESVLETMVPRTADRGAGRESVRIDHRHGA